MAAELSLLMAFTIVKTALAREVMAIFFFTIAYYLS